MTLKAAEDALSKDPKQALQPLIDAWKRQPSIEVRQLVTQLEHVVAIAPFKGHWRTAARRADPWTQSALLSSLRGGTIDETTARVKLVLAWGPDPRTSRLLEELAREVPWTSDGSKDLWRMIFRAITAMKDPRFVEVATTAPTKWSVRENIESWLRNGLRKAAGLGTVTPLEPQVLAAVKSLATKLVSLTPKKVVPTVWHGGSPTPSRPCLRSGPRCTGAPSGACTPPGRRPRPASSRWASRSPPSCCRRPLRHLS